MIRMESKERKPIPTKSIIRAVLIGIAAMIVLVVIYYPEWVANWEKQEQTKQQANQVVEAVIQDAKDGKIEPVDTKNDAWGHALKITANIENNNTKVDIVSAGPDGQFGTNDDITVNKEKKKQGWLSRVIWGEK